MDQNTHPPEDKNYKNDFYYKLSYSLGKLLCNIEKGLSDTKRKSQIVDLALYSKIQQLNPENKAFILTMIDTLK